MSTQSVPRVAPTKVETHSDGNAESTTFDYIIVGAGPSAIGLLYGLLSSYYDDDQEQATQNHGDDETNKSSQPSTPKISIAVIVRGPIGPEFLDRRPKENEQAASSSATSAAVLASPSTWYDAANSKPQSPQHYEQHHVCHHRIGLYGNRELDLPMGQGIGGSSNVNAMLSMAPLLEDFQYRKVPAPSSADAKGSVYHDFRHDWPEPWKTSLPNLWIPTIQQLIRQNGHVHHHFGIQASIPYQYRIYDDDYTEATSLDTIIRNCDDTSQNDTLRQQPVLHIGNQGVFNLIRHHVEDSPKKDTQRPPRQQSRWTRSNYYKALLEPFLIKQEQMEGTKNKQRLGTDAASHNPVAQSITWFHGVQVERILCETRSSSSSSLKRTVTGVEGRYQSNKSKNGIEKVQYIQLYARQDVILCAGAIETPALLLVDQLAQQQQQQQQQQQPMQIVPSDQQERPSSVEPLYGLGRNLQDQVLIPLAYLTPPSVWGLRTRSNLSPNGMAFLAYLTVPSKENDDRAGSKYNVFQMAVADATGQSSQIPPLLMLPFFRKAIRSPTSKCPTLLARIKYFVLNASYVGSTTLLGFALRYTPLGWFFQHFTSVAVLMLLHPYSSGSIHLRQRSPSTMTNSKGDTANKDDTRKKEPFRRHQFDLDIDIGYLQDNRDLQALKLGWEACEQLVRPNYITLFPPPSRVLRLLTKLFSIDWFWNWYCSSVSLPYYHFSGTCKMKASKEKGSEPVGSMRPTNNSVVDDWVVDADLRVRSYSKLRICDASVLPTTISAPPALTLVSMGFGLGQLLAKNLKDKMV